jgi:dolichol-phosphate mannosyltransferase
MDADLQHDERILRPMFEHLRKEGLDVVVGSRYVAGGGVGEWDASRTRASRWATKLAHLVCRQPVSDPMSGFFVFRREILDDTLRRLSGVGFKILLDLFASSPKPLRFGEWPYEFRARTEGRSKFDNRAIGEYLYLLLEKSVGRWIPTRFIVFSAVGALGVLVHMAVLSGLFAGGLASFFAAQTTATLVAMTFNFWLNNNTTYRDRRRTGWRWFTGLLGFYLACGIGAVANVGIATFLFDRHSTTWILSGLAGIVVGAVWNYAVTSIFTWSDEKK